MIHDSNFDVFALHKHNDAQITIFNDHHIHSYVESDYQITSSRHAHKQSHWHKHLSMISCLPLPLYH